MENVRQTAGQPRVVENMGLLDLSGMKEQDLRAMGEIRNIGAILVPEDLMGALMAITQSNVGAVVPIPTGGKVKMLSGQIKAGGELFANPSGAGNDVLVIAGQAIITSDVRQVGFAEIVIAGQLIAPKTSEEQLSSALSRVMGQVVYYSGDNARMFIGDDSFSKEFFDYIEGKMHMVLTGSFRFLPDVPASLVKEKISAITLIGELTVSKELLPLVQYLTVDNLGSIRSFDSLPQSDEEPAADSTSSA